MVEHALGPKADNRISNVEKGELEQIKKFLEIEEKKRRKK